MKDLIEKLLVFFGYEPSTEQITKPIAKIQARLERKAERHTARIDRATAEIERLKKVSEDNAKAAAESVALSDKYASLTA